MSTQLNLYGSEIEKFYIWYVNTAKLPDVRKLVKEAGGTMRHIPIKHECGAVRVYITLTAISWAAIAPRITTLRESLAVNHLQLERD